MAIIKFKDEIELSNRIDNYYSWCRDNNKHISVTGLAWYLGTNRKTLLNWINSKDIPHLNSSIDSKTKSNIIDILEEAYSKIEMEYEELLYNKSTVTGSIFTLKNNYNWKDKTEIESNNNTNLAIQDLTTEDLKALINQLEEE